jgi:RNase P/RNase MRP subunit POP5
LKRIKRRYLTLQIEIEQMPMEREFVDTVWSSITKLYGEFGASQTGLVLIAYDVEGKTAVIRTSLSTLSMVRASLASITILAGAKASVHVAAVSGTIKSLYER